MADTFPGDYAQAICADCGATGCTFRHNGPLSPDRQWHTFCAECWRIRNEAYQQSQRVPPLGDQWILSRHRPICAECGSRYSAQKCPDCKKWCELPHLATCSHWAGADECQHPAFAD